jgi:hypothetical protein
LNNGLSSSLRMSKLKYMELKSKSRLSFEVLRRISVNLEEYIRMKHEKMTKHDIWKDLKRFSQQKSSSKVL